MVEIKFNEIIEIHFSHLFLCLVKLAKLKFEINHQHDSKIFLCYSIWLKKVLRNFRIFIWILFLGEVLQFATQKETSLMHERHPLP